MGCPDSPFGQLCSPLYLFEHTSFRSPLSTVPSAANMLRLKGGKCGTKSVNMTNGAFLPTALENQILSVE
jgi:hypothetical protein